MRKDMSKVIVERPRLGRSYAASSPPGRSEPLVDEDDEPLRARKPKRSKPLRTKGLNENLAPLRRYLAKQVGRPWDKVYAEISENLRPRSTVQQHVRDHVQDFVAFQTRLRGGKVLTTPRWGGERELAEDHREFYVHPRTGILQKNRHYRSWSRRRKEKLAVEAQELAGRMREIDRRRQLHRLKDDVWWEVRLGRLSPNAEPDVVLSAGLSDLAPEVLYGRSGVRAIAKRQLSKTDKKRFGLK